MNVIILGSGGCVSTPRPCCNCPICTEARLKGFPYARTGCSLFIEDINVLIDTPEDINAALNNACIPKVEHILYSHCDPDHTMGMRVIEQLRMDWLAVSLGEKKIIQLKLLLCLPSLKISKNKELLMVQFFPIMKLKVLYI